MIKTPGIQSLDIIIDDDDIHETLSDTHKSRMYIVIDAGSGGTRAHLLSTTTVKNATKILPIDAEKSERLSLTQDKDCTDIINSVNTLKSRNGVKKTGGIWLRATAGLRLLNPYERTQLMQQVNSALITAFPAEFNSAEVMSGEEEGLFEWIQMNSQNQRGIFAYKTDFGIVSIGGASVQVTFAAHQRPRPNIIAFKKTPVIDGRMFYVYTHSWLGYGQKNLMDTFIQQQIEKGRFECGCLADTYNAQAERFYKYETIRGVSNFGECLYAIEDFLTMLDAKCDKPAFYDPCVFGDYLQPHTHSTFHAYGKGFELAKLSANALNKSIKLITPEDFLEAAKIVCPMKFQLSEDIPNCFSLIFYHFFFARLGFTGQETNSKIIFQGRKHGWVEGALRYELSNMNVKREL